MSKFAHFLREIRPAGFAGAFFLNASGSATVETTIDNAAAAVKVNQRVRRGGRRGEGEGVVDTVLLSEKIQIERKQFFIDLKENPRGRFLRITEEVGGRRDTIIVPSTGLDLFLTTIERAIEADKGKESGVPA